MVSTGSQPGLNWSQLVSIGLNWFCIGFFLPIHVSPKPERTKSFVSFLDYRQWSCCEWWGKYTEGLSNHYYNVFFPTQFHLKWELLPFNFESAGRKALFGAQIVFSPSSVLKHFFHCIVCVKLGSGIDTVCILVEMTPWKIQNWGCELYSDEKKMRRLQSLAMIPIWGRTGG